MSSTVRVFTRYWLLLVTLTVSNMAQQLPPPPPQHQVAILRQINHVNDDGSYTYGYEAADGSFKIETRDVLGTVRGMFGFVDESGQQRRVSYTAGNTTGFQTTRQPGAEDGGPEDPGVTSTPIKIYHPTNPPRLILRPVRPFLAAPSDGRDSVTKLIQHLGIIKTKQAETVRANTDDETARTTTSPKTTTEASEAPQKDAVKDVEVTTRRPTFVQRILRTRPRTNTRKEDLLPVNLRAPLETPSGKAESSTKKSEEEEKKEEGKSTATDSKQKPSLVALKVSENGGVPRFVVLPSRILRFRPNFEDDPKRRQDDRNNFQAENTLRAKLLSSPIQRDNQQYHFRQVSREPVSQQPLHVINHKTESNSNFRDQQFLPQKNVYAFVTTTPRTRLIQPQPINPVPTHSSLRLAPEEAGPMYQQAFEQTTPLRDATRLLFENGNYAEKIQQPQAYLQQQQMVYQQKPLVYNPDPRRYDPYYPRPNAFVPNLQQRPYPYYGRNDLLELLISYLQHQQNPNQPQYGFINPLPYDANISILPRQEFPQNGIGYQSHAVLLPYQAQYDQYQDNYRPIPTGDNIDIRRLLGLRALLRPSVRQQLEAQRPLAQPIVYANSYDVPYIKNKANAYPEDLYTNQNERRVNSQQEVPVRPTHLQFQPLFFESAPRHAITPQQQGFPTLTVRQDISQPKFSPLSVTTVAPRSTTDAPTQENQGLPYGFTKKFRSVQIITPETDESSEKDSKSN